MNAITELLDSLQEDLAKYRQLYASKSGDIGVILMTVADINVKATHLYQSTVGGILETSMELHNGKK